jgi:hypothetical protein
MAKSIQVSIAKGKLMELTMIMKIRGGNRRQWLCGVLVLLTLFASRGVIAGQTFLAGKISNVTFAGDTVFIKLDTGLPGNCAGTTSGWMMIPSNSKPMQSLMLGLWLRGDVRDVDLMVYTDGIAADGYCRINQIDPSE